MPTSRFQSSVFRWQPEEPGADPHPDLSLSERLREVSADRAASARELLLEASAALRHWLGVERARVAESEITAELELGWQAFLAAHQWRGSVARWERALRGVLALAPPHAHCTLRELLLEELGLWLTPEPCRSTHQTWNGEPLGGGPRLPERSAGPRLYAANCERGESILVHGWSESVAVALEHCFALGLGPRVILTEGGGNLGGRRLARRLAAAGLDLSLVYDLAAFEYLGQVDRVWLGSEAIGAGAFLANRGTTALLQRAREYELECLVVATSDKLTPDGALRLPEWAEQEGWLLWEDPASGVELDTQLYERVPAHLATAFLTEVGTETASQLALRAMPRSVLPREVCPSAETLAQRTIFIPAKQTPRPLQLQSGRGENDRSAGGLHPDSLKA